MVRCYGAPFSISIPSCIITVIEKHIFAKENTGYHKFIRIELSDHEASANLFASKLIESLHQTKTITSQIEDTPVLYNNESSDIMYIDNWRN